MNKEDLIFFHSWFDNYVRPFCSIDGERRQNVLQKLAHTKRVCAVASELSRLLCLDEHGRMMAEAIALFHDVGRFEQLQKYGTYNDEDSENHALISVRVLEREGVLECLSQEERGLVTCAVRHHNAYELPGELCGDELFFSRLVRDCDKLDIVWVELDYHRRRSVKPNAIMEMGLIDDGTYSQDLLEQVLHKRCICYGDMRTYYDLKLLLLSWVFDLNFNQSIRMFADKGYLDQIFDLLPHDEGVTKLRSLITSFIEGSLKSQKL